MTLLLTQIKMSQNSTCERTDLFDYVDEDLHALLDPLWQSDGRTDMDMDELLEFGEVPPPTLFWANHCSENTWISPGRMSAWQWEDNVWPAYAAEAGE